MAPTHPDAIFHAAAVSDFAFGRVWAQTPAGEKEEIKAGKIPTRRGALLAELLPTPKLIAELRDWFPQTRLVGWKFEVDGDRQQAVELAKTQIAECRVDACVVNGPAYGLGYGLVKADGLVAHLTGSRLLLEALEEFLRAT